MHYAPFSFLVKVSNCQNIVNNKVYVYLFARTYRRKI